MYFGPWRPDAAGPNSGYADVADSVLPQSAGQAIGYGPFPQLVTPDIATPLSGPPRGNISLVLNNGSYAVFYGTASTIEQLDSGFGFDVIDSGYAVPSGDDWSFEHFGAFLVLTNTVDGFLAYNVEAPAGINPVSTAPAARYVFSCNNVLFALDCDGNPRRMQSSGIGSITAWDSLGANGKTFEDGGNLVCGKDLKNGSAVIFQSDAMRLVQFGSAPGGSLYTIAKIADGRGSVGARSVVAFDGLVFYLATNGFWRFDLGGGNQPIGAEKVDRWFLNMVDIASLADVEGSIDPKNKIVCWRFKPISSPSETVYPMLIGYQWEIGEWFTVTVNTSSLSRLATPGYVLDDMDSFGTLDSMIQTPLDDRFWQGGQPVFAGLDENYCFAAFSGDAMAATVTSGVMNSGTQDVIRWVTPIDDSADGTMSMGIAPTLYATVTWLPGSTKVSAEDGRTPQRARAANLAFKREIPAGSIWSFINGFDYIGATQGGPS